VLHVQPRQVQPHLPALERIHRRRLAHQPRPQLLARVRRPPVRQEPAHRRHVRHQLTPRGHVERLRRPVLQEQHRRPRRDMPRQHRLPLPVQCRRLLVQPRHGPAGRPQRRARPRVLERRPHVDLRRQQRAEVLHQRRLPLAAIRLQPAWRPQPHLELAHRQPVRVEPLEQHARRPRPAALPVRRIPIERQALEPQTVPRVAHVRLAHPRRHPAAPPDVHLPERPDELHPGQRRRPGRPRQPPAWLVHEQPHIGHRQDHRHEHARGLLETEWPLPPKGSGPAKKAPKPGHASPARRGPDRSAAMGKSKASRRHRWHTPVRWRQSMLRLH
jgi:hypothetical protein